jgi:hypothetical protein
VFSPDDCKRLLPRITQKNTCVLRFVCVKVFVSTTNIVEQRLGTPTHLTCLTYIQPLYDICKYLCCSFLQENCEAFSFYFCVAPFFEFVEEESPLIFLKSPTCECFPLFSPKSDLCARPYVFWGEGLFLYTTRVLSGFALQTCVRMCSICLPSRECLSSFVSCSNFVYLVLESVSSVQRAFQVR